MTPQREYTDFLRDIEVNGPLQEFGQPPLHHRSQCRIIRSSALRPWLQAQDVEDPKETAAGVQRA